MKAADEGGRSAGKEEEEASFQIFFPFRKTRGARPRSVMKDMDCGTQLSGWEDPS